MLLLFSQLYNRFAECFHVEKTYLNLRQKPIFFGIFQLWFLRGRNIKQSRPCFCPIRLKKSVIPLFSTVPTVAEERKQVWCAPQQTLSHWLSCLPVQQTYECSNLKANMQHKLSLLFFREETFPKLGLWWQWWWWWLTMMPVMFADVQNWLQNALSPLLIARARFHTLQVQSPFRR